MRITTANGLLRENADIRNPIFLLTSSHLF
jgi:hypothetical protein